MTIIASRDEPATSAARRDLDAVMAIMDGAFDPRFGEGWSRAQCRGMLGDTNSWIIVDRQDDRPVGFALSRMIVDEAELLLIAVQPEYRGKGIGRNMLKEVARTARARGAARLHLEVRDGNAAADLYSAIGFEQIGRRKNYYSGRDGEHFDAITLALQLDAPAEQ
ncbi:ribosomal protein S18-alanine N-acetyltransferase [Parasphingopyxis sp.]|uniref:ribosomal protein S18-alanine N-acetyltransferase n=1 Tax=Parasphingopyxis sp. TaxID=1920299 RepID=UPI00261E7936|nr:ribosomal protein S18-alanine N-acetyltransferase [Parasphingopyxis sp.]